MKNCIFVLSNDHLAGHKLTFLKRPLNKIIILISLFVKFSDIKDQEKDRDKGPNIPAIIGGSFAVLIMVVGIIVTAFVVQRYRSKCLMKTNLHKKKSEQQVCLATKKKLPYLKIYQKDIAFNITKKSKFVKFKINILV